MNQPLQRVMEASPVGMVVLDCYKTVRYANQAARHIFKRDSPAAGQMKFGNFLGCMHVHGDSHDCGRAEECRKCRIIWDIGTALGENEPPAAAVEGETLLKRSPVSRSVWIKYKINRIAVGQRPGVMLAIDDISAHKSTIQALQYRSRQLGRAVEMARLGPWEYDIARDIFTFNDYFYHVFKTTADQVGGYTMSCEQYLQHFVYPEDLPLAMEEIERAKQLKPPNLSRKFDHRIVYGDGTPGHISVHYCVVLDSRGQAVKTVGVDQDISEMKRIESLLQQSQKIESIGVLAGGIAHNFNNVLFPIMGISEMLMEDLRAGSPEYDKAADIYMAAKRGSDLVKQILTFSYQSGYQKTPIRLQATIAETLQLARSTIPANIGITAHLQEDCGLIRGDVTQVHQIVLNLITNAYHAVEKSGGQIVVSLKQTELSRDDFPASMLNPGPYALISISDNGCGIEAELLGKIFEPYFTTKERGKGTGLGLSVVYGIVKSHGGDIRVRSKAGQGTVFDVYLPVIGVDQELAVAVQTTPYETGMENILLVDDEEPVLQIEKQMLERLGYRVTARLGSIDALSAFQAAPQDFDLVMTDMTMPHMTGDQLARRLLDIRPDIALVICTGFSEKLSSEQAEQLGIEGYLMKPVGMAQLAQTIRQILDKRNNAAAGRAEGQMR